MRACTHTILHILKYIDYALCREGETAGQTNGMMGQA